MSSEISHTSTYNHFRNRIKNERRMGDSDDDEALFQFVHCLLAIIQISLPQRRDIYFELPAGLLGPSTARST
jgi:hypothetical protein